MIEEGRVLGALSTVRDPELDEPITDLGFVKEVRVEGDSVTVTLQLPTYFCAPNFAYIMAADAKAAVGALEGVERCTVTLFDHHASQEINEGLAAGKDFDAAFAGQTTGAGLAGVRSLFDRKAFLARQEQLYRSLVEAGMPPGHVARLSIGDLPDTEEARRYLERRARLGIDSGKDAPLLVTPAGQPIAAANVDRHMRFARTISVSMEGNASFCRGLLATRYGTAASREVRT